MGFIKSTEAVEQPLVATFDPNNGWSNVRRFRGARAYILAKESQLISEGYSIRTTDAGDGVCELEATISGDFRDGGSGSLDIPVDTWELSSNAFEKDLLQYDDLYGASTLSDVDYATLRDCLDGKINFQNKSLADVEALFTAVGREAGVRLYYIIAAGTKSVQLDQCVLRKSQTVSNQYTIPLSTFKVGWFWSTTRLTATEQIPASIKNQLPTSGWDWRHSSTVQVYKAWKKLYPQIQVISRGRSQLVQEWHWGEWAAGIYASKFYE